MKGCSSSFTVTEMQIITKIRCHFFHLSNQQNSKIWAKMLANLEKNRNLHTKWYEKNFSKFIKITLVGICSKDGTFLLDWYLWKCQYSITFYPKLVIFIYFNLIIAKYWKQCKCLYMGHLLWNSHSILYYTVIIKNQEALQDIREQQKIT